MLHGFNEEILSLRARLQAQEQRLELQDAKIKLQEQQLATAAAATAAATASSHAQITEYHHKEILKLYENITMANSKIAFLEQSLLTATRAIKETSRRVKYLNEQRYKDKAQTLEMARKEAGDADQKEALGVRPGPVHQTDDFNRWINEVLQKYIREHFGTDEEHTDALAGEH